MVWTVNFPCLDLAHLSPTNMKECNTVNMPSIMEKDKQGDCGEGRNSAFLTPEEKVRSSVITKYKRRQWVIKMDNITWKKREKTDGEISFTEWKPKAFLQ